MFGHKKLKWSSRRRCGEKTVMIWQAV